MPSRSEILDAVQHPDLTACLPRRARLPITSLPSRTRRIVAVPSTISGYLRRLMRLNPLPSIFSFMKCMRTCLAPKSGSGTLTERELAYFEADRSGPSQFARRLATGFADLTARTVHTNLAPYVAATCRTMMNCSSSARQ
jgi:hypothetical protein